MSCALCKSETEQRLIRYVQEFDGRVVVIENVPAEVCAQCGEEYIRPEVARKIQRLVWEEPSPKKTLKVPYYDFEKVA